MTSDPVIPMPLQIVIDDVGWRRGRDDSGHGGPFRTGMDRLHGAEDYLAIAELGRALNMRPQAAMIMGEWDRESLADLLHADPGRNGEVVQRWANLLAPLEERLDRTLSTDTGAWMTQLVHHAWTSATRQGDTLEIDARRFFACPWAQRPDHPMLLKWQDPQPLCLETPQGHRIMPVHTRAGLHAFSLELSADQPRRNYLIRRL